MSQPVLLSTEHRHLLSREGNRNNSSVCFAISSFAQRTSRGIQSAGIVGHFNFQMQLYNQL